MEQHEFSQGSPAWHEHRLTHHNASDSPAMLGLSKHKTRTQLLHERATGITKDIDPATQRLFDRGHRFEALARPLAEEIIGKKLYPVVGSIENFSASFDGLTMDEAINFEHKTLNAELQRVLEAGEPLPEMYTSQIEQQHMVSGAEKTLFMASAWDDYDNLIAEYHCWVEPDLAMRKRILAGWAQFEQDLDEYVPSEAVVAPVAETTEALPALSIQATGAITILSNLDIFGAKLTEFVGHLNLKPETDQDFANAEAAVKVLANAQTALEAAEANALAQASDVDAMRRTVAAYAKTARDTRLMLEKVIKAEKENRKMAIVAAAKETFAKHIMALESEIMPIALSLAYPDFGGAIKGLKTISSIQDKVNGALATGKIEADAKAQDIRGKLVWFREDAINHDFLFRDLQQIILDNGIEAFKAIATQRIDAHKQAEESRLTLEREKIRAEEEAKAAEKVRADEEARTKADNTEPRPSPPLVTPPELPKASEIGLVGFRETLPLGSPEPGAPPVADTWSPEQRRAVINLGEINRRLGFSVSSDFLESLGFAARVEKNAKLYSECDFPAICRGISQHVLKLAATGGMMAAA